MSFSICFLYSPLAPFLTFSLIFLLLSSFLSLPFYSFSSLSSHKPFYHPSILLRPTHFINSFSHYLIKLPFMSYSPTRQIYIYLSSPSGSSVHLHRPLEGSILFHNLLPPLSFDQALCAFLVLNFPCTLLYFFVPSPPSIPPVFLNCTAKFPAHTIFFFLVLLHSPPSFFLSFSFLSLVVFY